MPWGLPIRRRACTAIGEQGLSECIGPSTCPANETTMDSSYDASSLIDEDWELVPSIKRSGSASEDDVLGIPEIAFTKSDEKSPREHEAQISTKSDRDTNGVQALACHASLAKKESLSITAFRQQQRLPSMIPSILNSCNDPAQSQFLETIRAKNENVAILLLVTGDDPKSADEWGPAITQALRAKLKRLVRILLARGADPDAADVWGPVLTQTIRAGDRDFASRLIQKGACPNAQDVWGPALTQAIRSRMEQLAIMLINHGANAKAEDTWGSALAQSAKYELHALTTILLDAGAAFRTRDVRHEKH